MAQVIKHLPSKHKVMSSVPKRKKEKTLLLASDLFKCHFPGEVSPDHPD
jgi:hypothetical protein